MGVVGVTEGMEGVEPLSSAISLLACFKISLSATRLWLGETENLQNELSNFIETGLD